VSGFPGRIGPEEVDRLAGVSPQTPSEQPLLDTGQRVSELLMWPRRSWGVPPKRILENSSVIYFSS
jgi:hypothetical protein